VLFLFRPIIVLPPSANRDAIVPVLVDVSRSMRLPEDTGRTRAARAAAIVTTYVLPSLSGHYQPELFGIGDGLSPISPEGLHADARRTDLAGAVAAVRERYRGQRVAGIVLLSDGGDTGSGGSEWSGGSSGFDGEGPPVFAIGIGSPDGPRDREVLGITAGDPRLDHASIDLHVTAVSSGFGRMPFQLRVLANAGR